MFYNVCVSMEVKNKSEDVLIIEILIGRKLELNVNVAIYFEMSQDKSGLSWRRF